MTTRFTRRGLLRSTVAGGVASHLLPFFPHAARAQTGSPKRLLVVFHPMGYLENAFFPTIGADATDFTLNESMAPLAAFKNKMIILDGLENRGGVWTYGYVNKMQLDNEHGLGMASAFTGSGKVMSNGQYADSASIDQVVASKVYTQTPTKFKNIALGVNAGAPGGHSSCFFSGPSTPVNNQNSPAAAFDSLFRDLPTGGGMDNTEALVRVKKQRQSVIDLVKSELNDLCGRVGKAEQDKCEAHLTGIRQMENALLNLKPTVTATCSKPATPSAADLQATAQSQMDIITAAFSCDLTRVATLQMGGADGGSDPPGFNHHNTAHAVGDSNMAPDVMAAHRKIDLWFNERFSYLLRKLDSVQEADGTLLDNTLILFGSDTTQGTSSGMVGAHQATRFPFWLAGGSNFAFKTGRAIRYTTPALKKWVPHNRLLVSIAQKFGVEVDKFGTHDPASGTLAML